MIGRALRDGLSWLRHRTRLRGYGPAGFHPSRTVPPEPDAFTLDVLRRSKRRVEDHARALGFKVPD